MSNPLPAGLDQLSFIFSRVITLAVGLAFVALFVMLIISGIMFMVSGGESKALQAAKQSASWAIAGMVFLIIAWLVLRLTQAFTGVDVTHICFSFSGCR